MLHLFPHSKNTYRSTNGVVIEVVGQLEVIFKLFEPLHQSFGIFEVMWPKNGFFGYI